MALPAINQIIFNEFRARQTGNKFRGGQEEILKEEFETFVPSSGGFSEVGVNAGGQTVFRDNVTGKLTLDPSTAQARELPAQFARSPEASALGKQKTPLQLARLGRGRRAKRTTRGKDPQRATAVSKNILGESSILGQQSILG